MFSSLLAVATTEVEVHAAAAADGGLVHELVEKFGIDGVNVGMQLLSFTILAVVLYRFAVKPVLSTMDERTRKIEAGLKHAEDMKAQLAAAQQESAAILKGAQGEATRIIEEARKAAKEFGDKSQKEATERANGLVTKAQQAIELEHKKMLADARTEIARLVVTTTERVLAKKLSDNDRAGYNEAASKELAGL